MIFFFFSFIIRVLKYKNFNNVLNVYPSDDIFFDIDVYYDYYSQHNKRSSFTKVPLAFVNPLLAHKELIIINNEILYSHDCLIDS